MELYFCVKRCKTLLLLFLISSERYQIGDGQVVVVIARIEKQAVVGKVELMESVGLPRNGGCPRRFGLTSAAIGSTSTVLDPRNLLWQPKYLLVEIFVLTITF